MKFKSKGISKKPGRLSSCIVFYIAALVTALMGIVLLVNNVIMFRKTVNQYVAQGYSANIVLEQLVPSQLLPGIFQCIGLYGGITCILIGIGIINKKLSKFFGQLDNGNHIPQEDVAAQEVIDINEVETLEDIENKNDMEAEHKKENTEKGNENENNDIKDAEETNKEG
ncbi:hypothetical protein [Clostridium sp.]|mgnify:FL=1|uniref:hypothetical protein n=1 Tax=Clostridium sp. TaxID=1506 RepID=UPI002FDDD5E8